MIYLLPISEQGFEIYLKEAIISYAEEKVKAGNWIRENSLDKAAAEYGRLLPEGKSTKNNYLYEIKKEEKTIGFVWLALKTPQRGFIYDIKIFPAHQRNGFGKETLILIEEQCSKLGIEKIGLQVFPHNKRAIALYNKHGYEVTNMKMEKEIQKNNQS
ncbi:GNAT family N-acetyltransferase [Alkalicoccus daliensis]|uniref:Acetyltransferase (GNAT) family protein n=1 Tax=Alkalicoccus daliensis TaxID=745820 RepID=A0A1G9Z9T5_9BACI|nr:GNAT family N-acetyltransferase [Alkalicoccus daliensis]SDN18129.1 Acetyltransferase (GNAT) family protein [Alkalicoccus daliensis]